MQAINPVLQKYVKSQRNHAQWRNNLAKSLSPSPVNHANPRSLVNVKKYARSHQRLAAQKNLNHALLKKRSAPAKRRLAHVGQRSLGLPKSPRKDLQSSSRRGLDGAVGQPHVKAVMRMTTSLSRR